jgi:hypothetical protein
MPIGNFNKLNKFGEQLWNGVNNVNAIAQTITPLISAASGVPFLDTIVDAFGSIVNGANEIMATNAMNREIKKWNAQNEKEVAELNEFSRQQAKEQRDRKAAQEKAEFDYFHRKYDAKPMTQAQKDLANSFTPEDRKHLENIKMRK